MSPYDYENIPLVTASIVSIDAELSDDPLPSAQVIMPEVSTSTTTTVDSDMTPNSSVVGNNNPNSSSNGMHPASSAVPGNPSSTSDTSEGGVVVDDDEAADKAQTLGAGAAGAVVGMLVGGPALSLIMGFGTAYYTKKEGPAGDLARAMGDVALLAKEKWNENRARHHSRCHMHRCRHREHVKEQFIRCITKLWASTLEYVERNKLIERGSEKLKILIDHCAAQLLEFNRRVGPERTTGEERTTTPPVRASKH